MPLALPTHEDYMRQALAQAQLAYDAGEVPVGAVMVLDGRVISRGYNQTETLRDPTAHAEMLAITAATHYLGAKYLTQCTLYVTLEPCLMCGAALGWEQLGGLVIGAADLKKGYQVMQPKALHPKTKVLTGVLADECQAMLLSFFGQLRK